MSKMIKFKKLDIPDVILVQPDIIKDHRGYFMETYHIDKFSAGGISCNFVQDNYAQSVKNTLRGLHFQEKIPQAKLVRCTYGKIFDVAVDIRLNSPYFGQWVGLELSNTNNYQLFIPEGFAHGYCVLSDRAEIAYKCSNIYYPKYDSGVIWNDNDLNIKWPLKEPILSDKDSKLLSVKKYFYDI
tara:strand:- start:832 stop:1383 length:552 start_codon:yes stop_codon:yes gene_type:complete